MLRLEQVRQQRKNRPDYAAHDSISYVEFLHSFLQVETQARRKRYLKARLRLAHFPAVKRLEDFDWAFQPSLQRAGRSGRGYRDGGRTGRPCRYQRDQALCIANPWRDKGVEKAFSQ